MTEPLHIAVLTCLWGRRRLTELFLRYYEAWAEQAEAALPVRLTLQATISPGDAALYPVHQTTRWQYVVAPNEPLTDKWIAGCQALRHATDRPDAVIIMGSDDFVDLRYLRVVLVRLQAGARYLEPDGIYLYCTERQHLVYVKCQRIGAGRVITSEVLDSVGWAPWERGVSRAIDQTQNAVLAEYSGNHLHTGSEQHGFTLLDVKTGHNIWSFERLVRMLPVTQIDAERYLRKHLPIIADDLLTWNANVEAG
ncbi:MAG: hypothetical protein GVY18_18705 [Bacteroidetes bacterium]|jgi:hypothetical protein|nr:hypothetical protein [Bacteroidota bacterium]